MNAMYARDPKNTISSAKLPVSMNPLTDNWWNGCIRLTPSVVRQSESTCANNPTMSGKPYLELVRRMTIAPNNTIKNIL
ncbi:hypothetical protein CL622_05005, partial [archaeon]|nr:hypothetical protein [archaeon]